MFLLAGFNLSSQSEYVVHSAAELVKVLHDQRDYTFSYPEEIMLLQGESLIINSNVDQSGISGAFGKMGCDVLFLTDKHLLLRASLQPENRDFSRIIIKDRKSGEAIGWAALSLPEKNGVLFSDEAGIVQVEKGKQDAVVSMLGYKPQNLHLDGQNERVVFLDPDPISLRQVEKKDFPMALKTDDGNSVVNYTKPYALLTRGLNGIDVFTAVQSLPGVDATSESIGKIAIRGSQSDETLILVDELPVISNAHYFDLFGTINPFFIQGFELYKNTYPTQYSGRTGGVLAITSKDPSPEKFSGALDVNFLTASGAVFVPLDKHWSLSAALRSSIREISNNQFYSLNPFNLSNYSENGNSPLNENTVRSSPEFSFGDMNVKLNYRGQKTTFQLAFNSIWDQFENELNFNIPEPGRPLEQLLVKHELQNLRSWQSQTFGMVLTHQFNASTSLNLSAYKAHFGDEYQLKINLGYDRPGGFKGRNNNDFESEVSKGGFTAFALKQLNLKSNFKLGYDLEVIDNENALTNAGGRLSGFNSQAVLNNVFGEYQWQNSQGLKFEMGSRLSLADNGKLYPSFQTGLYRDFTSGLRLRAAAGYNYQLHRRIDIRDVFDQSLSIWSVANDQIPALSAASLSTGIGYKTGVFLADAEFYYKALNGVGEYANPQPGVRLDEEETKTLQLYTGQGKSYGLDLLSRYESAKYSTQLSYSWSKLIYQIPGVFRGLEYYAPLDRRHQLKSYHLYRLGDFSINASWIYATGQPYLVGNRIQGDEQLGDLETSRFLDRLPDYSRIDAGLSYVFKFKRIENQISLQLFNVTNRQNVKMVHYLSQIKPPKGGTDEAVVTGTVTNMLSRTLNLGYTIRF